MLVMYFFFFQAEDGIRDLYVTGVQTCALPISDLVRLSADGTISSAGAKHALAEAFVSGDPIEAIIDANGLRQVSDASALEAVIDEVIAENAGPAEQFRAGKEGVLGFLVGQVMRKTK